MYDNFEFLQSRNIDPAIPVRKGAIDILKHPRSEKARKQKDFDRWKDEKEYGMRWMVETAYSAFKRYFGGSKGMDIQFSEGNSLLRGVC